MKNYLQHFKINLLFLSVAFFAAFSTNTYAGESAGDYHALFIAIDDYNSSDWSQLKNPVRDAKSIQQVLKNKYGFKTITNLFNEDATRANIIETIDDITGKLTESDHLLIYYTGHGIEIGSDGYWVPANARSKERYELLSTVEIKNAIGNTKARHVLVMVDACFSGSIFKTSSLTYNNDGSTTYYDRMEGLLSRQALTAGGLEPVPDGTENHSVYAKYILKFLNINEKPAIDANELFELVKYPISANTPNTPLFGHIQNTGHEGGQFIFRQVEEKLCDSPVYFEEGEVVKFDKDGGTLHARTNIKNVKYEWSYNSEIIDFSGPNLPIKKSGMYGVTIITEDGDCSNSAIAEVEIIMPNIIVDILEGKTIEFIHKGTLNATISGYKDDVKYEWKKGNFVISKESRVEVTESETYTVIIKLLDGRELGRATTTVSIKERIYKTQMGDNIDRIARKFYDDPSKSVLIYNANPELKRGEPIRVGISIKIPTDGSSEDNTKLVIGTNEAFPPFSDPNSLNGGMLTDIIQTVYGNMDKTAKVDYMASNRLRAMTYSGRIDAGFPFVKNAADAKMFLYSDPLYTSLNVFFSNKGSDVKDIETIMKKRMKRNNYQRLIVAVPAGFNSDKLTEYVRMGYISLKPYKSLEDCFIAIKNEEVDLVGAQQIAGLVAIKNTASLDRLDFVILEKSIETNTLHLAISKEHPEAELLLQGFNTALAKAKSNGAIGKIIDTHIDLIQKGKP